MKTFNSCIQGSVTYAPDIACVMKFIFVVTYLNNLFYDTKVLHYVLPVTGVAFAVHHGPLKAEVNRKCPRIPAFHHFN